MKHFSNKELFDPSCFYYCKQTSTCTVLRERSLFMAEVGAEEKALGSLKKVLPHHFLKSNFLYPTEGKQ